MSDMTQDMGCCLNNLSFPLFIKGSKIFNPEKKSITPITISLLDVQQFYSKYIHLMHLDLCKQDKLLEILQ